MRILSAVIAGLALLTALAVAPHETQAQIPAELAGGWLVTSWTSPEGVRNDSPQRGLFVFAATGQYSMMYVLGDAPRPRYEGESLTDAEKLAAYDSFVANSGRYSVTGNVISYEAYMAKDPNYMADFNVDTRANVVRMTFSIADGILTLRWEDGFTPGQTATLRRPGQAQGND